MSSASYRSLQSEHRLAEVIGQMVRAAQQDGEAIARSVFGEIFFRYGSVPLDPVGQRHFFQTLRQFTVLSVLVLPGHIAILFLSRCDYEHFRLIHLFRMGRDGYFVMRFLSLHELHKLSSICIASLISMPRFKLA